MDGKMEKLYPRSGGDNKAALVFQFGNSDRFAIADEATEALIDAREESVDIIGGTLDLEIDGTVGLVSHEAGDGQIAGEMSGGGTEADALDTSVITDGESHGPSVRAGRAGRYGTRYDVFEEGWGKAARKIAELPARTGDEFDRSENSATFLLSRCGARKPGPAVSRLRADERPADQTLARATQPRAFGLSGDSPFRSGGEDPAPSVAQVTEKGGQPRDRLKVGARLVGVGSAVEKRSEPSRSVPSQRTSLTGLPRPLSRVDTRRCVDRRRTR
jgi:hypothetical protein